MFKFIEFAIAVAILLLSIGGLLYIIGHYRIQWAKADAIDRDSKCLNDEDF